MNNLPLKALVWIETSVDGFVEHTAQGAGIFYRIFRSNEDIKVIWVDSMGGSDGNKLFKFLDEAKYWIETEHYPHKMQPYVKPSPTWIDASKHLPNVDRDTQFICAYDSVIDTFSKVAWFNADIGEFDYQHDDVLAWIPIPEFKQGE